MELLLQNCYFLTKSLYGNFGNIVLRQYAVVDRKIFGLLLYRGIGDQPYWAAFEDAPVGEKERAEVINRMLRIQLDMIKKERAILILLFVSLFMMNCRISWLKVI